MTGSPQSAGQEFRQIRRLQRRSHRRERAMRLLIGWPLVARFHRLPFAGWYVIHYHLMRRTYSTQGPFRSKQQAQKFLADTGAGVASHVYIRLLWEEPQGNYNPGHVTFKGWRRRCLAHFSQVGSGTP